MLSGAWYARGWQRSSQPIEGAWLSSNTAERNVGRLVEVAIDAGYQVPADVDAVFDVIETLTTEGEHTITVADWRQCALMSPEASDRLRQRLVSSNHHVLRSAGLASSSSPASVLQLLRVVREAALPDRKTFLEPRELTRWLEDVLTDEEAARLRLFLSRPATR